MTSKQFFKYLLEPDQINDSTVVEIEQMIKQFPFFQTAHLLYLKALNRINPKIVKEKLPVESLYVSDRATLYTMLKNENKATSTSLQEPKQATIVSSTSKQNQDTKTANTTVKDTTTDNNDKKIATNVVDQPKEKKVEQSETKTTTTKEETKIETKTDTNKKIETSKSQTTEKKKKKTLNKH